MDLQTTVDIDMLQQFQDSFALSTGVSCLAEDIQGNALTCPSYFSDCCLQMVRKSKIGLNRCLNCDMRGAEDAARTGKPVIYQCHAGFVDFAAPIMVEGRYIGAIYGGQVLNEPPQDAKLYQKAVEMGIDPDQYIAAVKRLPVLPESTINAAANTLHLMAQNFSNMIKQKKELKTCGSALLRANSRLNHVLETISDVVLITDESHKIVQVNKRAEEIIGKTVSELINKPVLEIIGRETPKIKKLLRLHEAYSDLQVPMETKDGQIYCLSSSRPIQDEQGLVAGDVVILRPLEKSGRSTQRTALNQATFQMQDIIGESPEIHEIKRIITRIASGNASILLEGESGTGKEVIAQVIHNESPRRCGPFIAVNCGALPKELINSELFGFTEGAFTGAKKGGSPGKFELASGGTIFLDEIGEMPLEQQVVLLRVLQEKTITRVGGNTLIPVDVRVICASNKQLQDEIARGNFRQDLYYRLNTLSLNIPPLRSRPEDIPILFNHFLNILGRERGRTFNHIEPEVMECLQQHTWPGNIRELQNAAERIIAMTEGDSIRLQDLPRNLLNNNQVHCVCNAQPPQVVPQARKRNKWRELKAEQEAHKIRALLDEYDGNVTKAALELGISRNTLYRKLNKFDISPLR
ncbi:MAG: sigma 54-interacting transcriptional regulator [Syntrophomonadaceae bacterium]|nr:sigma 54-interacting transcriptional regulator [Syntrophomonadaceae bacterium]